MSTGTPRFPPLPHLPSLSGVFVITGLICHEIAGPAGVLSWVVAGFGCLLSGLSFAELSWRVPSAGG